jgi:CRP-like cAMP-binding protein
MNEAFRQYLHTYERLTEAEFSLITAHLKTRQLRRGEYLLQVGQVCQDFIFVEQGCLRYVLPAEIDLTVWLAFPNNFGSEAQSYLSGQPSRFYVEAIEDTKLVLLSKAALETLCQRLPKLHILVRKIWEEGIVYMIERMVSLQADPAPKRYLDLIRDPDYMQRIPQKYLASYLGVTPSSLSRIRRRIILE